MKAQTVTREQVMALVKAMPGEKLATWYEYGLFIQSRPVLRPASGIDIEADADLAEELAAWEAASDEDWLKIEQMVPETASVARGDILLIQLRGGWGMFSRELHP